MDEPNMSPSFSATSPLPLPNREQRRAAKRKRNKMMDNIIQAAKNMAYADLINQIHALNDKNDNETKDIGDSDDSTKKE